ncbi:MAG: lyase family protein, partial [Chloroflexota bacterium]|nr:lyase family protein [Chloroflexota bacterium]
GTSWPIDREMTARLLGFSRVWEVPQDAIGSRGLPQLAYLDLCKRLALAISKIAADLLLFTTWEFGYAHLGEAVSQRQHPITGSSVMAQKRNPDALELLRATGPEVIGLAGTAANLLTGLPMGYNRDTREIKEWSALGFSKTLSALGILRTTLLTLRVDKDRMLEAVRANYSSTTDLADMVAQRSGVGYRRIYPIIGGLVDTMMEESRPLHTLRAGEIIEAAARAGIELSITDNQVAEALDPQLAVALRAHIGGAAPVEMVSMLASRADTLAQHRDWIGEQRSHLHKAKAGTLSQVSALSQGSIV